MAASVKTTPRTIGRQTVRYRNAKGKTRDAVVTGGTGTSLNLVVPAGGGGTLRLTGIAKATGVKQTNVWFEPQ
jgi:hypothetical protein